MGSSRGICCPTCGRKDQEHRHKLNRPMAEALVRAWRVNRLKPFNPSHDLGLSHSQLANWQKLRYWGLIGKEDGDPDGTWRITKFGVAFLGGQIVTARVWTYRGKLAAPRPEDPAEECVTIGEVIPGFELREDYARAARPRPVDGQGNLFEVSA